MSDKKLWHEYCLGSHFVHICWYEPKYKVLYLQINHLNTWAIFYVSILLKNIFQQMQISERL